MATYGATLAGVAHVDVMGHANWPVYMHLFMCLHSLSVQCISIFSMYMVNCSKSLIPWAAVYLNHELDCSSLKHRKNKCEICTCICTKHFFKWNNRGKINTVILLKKTKRWVKLWPVMKCSTILENWTNILQGQNCLWNSENGQLPLHCSFCC